MKESTQVNEIAQLQDSANSFLSFENLDDFKWLDSIDWGRDPCIETSWGAQSVFLHELLTNIRIHQWYGRIGQLDAIDQWTDWSANYSPTSKSGNFEAFYKGFKWIVYNAKC